MCNITLQEHISPIEVILTNNRCLKVVNGKGQSLQDRPVHSPCIAKKNFWKSLGLDLIYTLMLFHILDCVNNTNGPQTTPIPKVISMLILKDIDHMLKYQGNNPLSIAVKEIRTSSLL